jgi:hypothetical protein
MKVEYNKPLIAMLLSILGALPAGIFTEVMKSYNLVTFNAAELISMMFIREGSFLLGILAYIGYSAVLGLILYYSPKLLGLDYFVLKAMFLSMVAESLFYIVFGSFMRNEFLLQDAIGNYVLSSAAAIGGIVRGFLIRKYLFQNIYT